MTTIDRLPARSPTGVDPSGPGASGSRPSGSGPPAGADLILLDGSGGHDGNGRDVAQLGLRERKKQATRRELERVAFELFSERGFDGVTVDDITAAAKVSKRTFYRYFESKEDVLLSDQRRQLDALRAALDARPADEPLLTSVRLAILNMADQYHHGRDVLVERTRLIMVTPSLASRSTQHHILWERSLADMIGTRLGIDPEVELLPRLAAATLLAALRVTLEHWLQGDEPLDGVVDDALTTVAELFGDRL